MLAAAAAALVGCVGDSTLDWRCDIAFSCCILAETFSRTWKHPLVRSCVPVLLPCPPTPIPSLLVEKFQSWRYPVSLLFSSLSLSLSSLLPSYLSLIHPLTQCLDFVCMYPFGPSCPHSLASVGGKSFCSSWSYHTSCRPSSFSSVQSSHMWLAQRVKGVEFLLEVPPTWRFLA